MARSSQQTSYGFHPRVEVQFAQQVAQLWSLAQQTQEPLQAFLKVMLFHDKEELAFTNAANKVLVKYSSRFYRALAVRDYLTRLDQVPVTEIMRQTGQTKSAVVGRLDKCRDAFQVYLVGGLTLGHRAVAYQKLKEMSWHEEDIAAVLRTSVPRLKHYSQAVSLPGNEFVRKEAPRGRSRNR